MNLSYYCTVAEAREELRVDDTTTRPIDDVILYDCIRQASARFDAEANHTRKPATFEPVTQTYTFHLRTDRIDSIRRLFMFPVPLLSLTSATVYGQALTAGTDVIAYPAGVVPSRALQLVSTCGDWYSTYYSCDASPLVQITGQWGWHWDYDTAWQDSNDTVQDNPLGATTTSLTVNDADGVDYQNLTPRFSPGHLIRVESEYMRVTAVNTSTNVLTVQRGLHNTTAAAHAKDTVIYTYYADPNIKRAAARQAGMLYLRRGAFDEPAGQLGGLAYPTDLLTEIRGILQQYVRGGSWL